MSSDEHPGILTPDILEQHIRTVDVADLTGWDGPWEGDLGAAHTYLGTFGQFALPIVWNGEVVHGQEYVAAEQKDAQLDGKMTVVDVTDLGWPKEKVIAAALGLHQVEARATTDREHLAALLVEVREANPDWLTGAGYDGDDIDDMLAQFEAPPSLGDLEREHGSFTDDDVEQFWPKIILQVHPDAHVRWTETFAELPGDTDTDRLLALLDLLEGAEAEPEPDAEP